jgi:hypothetical protein
LIDGPKECHVGLLQAAPAIMRGYCVQHRASSAAELFGQIYHIMLKPDNIDADAKVGKGGRGSTIRTFGADRETRDDQAKPIQHERSKRRQVGWTSVGGDSCNIYAVTP